MTDRDFWLQIRQALLMFVDTVERHFDIEPRTSELRKERKSETRHLPVKPDWRCAECGQMLPYEYDTCHQCGALRRVG